MSEENSYMVILKVTYESDFFTKQWLQDSLPLAGVFNNSFCTTEIVKIEKLKGDQK